MRRRPRVSEAQEVLAAAFGARAMARGERRRLVEEEELREPPRTKERPAATLEHEPAGDPSPDLPRADEPPVLVVEHATVAEQQPPGFGGDDVAGRRDPVLTRHGAEMLRRSARVGDRAGSTRPPSRAHHRRV